eukprot:scaffold10766_cov554-Chaetoceros_neogracile.AAC.2
MFSSAKKRSKKEKKRRHSTSTTPSEKNKSLASSSSSIKKEQLLSRSSKKVKFESSAPSQPAKCLTFPSKYTNEIKIEVQEPDSSKDPVVVSFPAGLPSSSSTINNSNSNSNSNNTFELDDTNQSSAPVFTWTSARKSSSKGRILMGNDDTCTYTSMNDGRGHDGRLTKQFIAIYHKPTHTLKFIPSSEKGTVFSMNQNVTSYHDSKSFEFRNLSMNERRRMVFESFGSQKKKKVMRSQDANVVEMKSVVGAGEGMMKALGSQMEGGAVSESNKRVMEDLRKGSSEKPTTAVDKAFAEARRAFLPPFDETATKPYRVYDSQEVAGEEAWAQISRVVDACINQDDWKEALQKWPWPESTAKLLDLVSDPSRKGAKYQLKTICLVNHLVKFHNRASKKFMDGSAEEMVKYLGLPKAIADRFLELFCVASYDRGRAGYATTKQLKDRRVIYTLVMYLLAHGKEMKAGSVDKLCLDMSMETKDAINLYREAGCKCVRGKSGMVSVSLVVPLVFPNPKRGKKT